MIPITYLIGDATRPTRDGNKIIVHNCNNAGAWGAGFVLAISRRWPAPERQYRMFHRSNPKMLALGSVQFVNVEPDIVVANVIGQVLDGSHPPIRYEALKFGLLKVSNYANEIEASVHMPRIGCGLAGGEWATVETLVKAAFSEADVPVFVYDLKEAE